jgi:ABC-type antimicrobial peptide transport system permease subunit
MGIPLRRGRHLTDRDVPGAPRVIVINEALAARYFPNEDPIGRETNRGTIVGVVGDVRSSGLDHPPFPEIYYPFAQNTAATSNAGVAMVVSTRLAPEALTNSVHQAIQDVNPRQAIFGVKTMRQVVTESLADLNLYLWLIGLFASLALALAITGIYGVVSFVVAARTHEFGIRMALGADGGRILRLVLGRGALLVGGGLVAGAGGTWVATRTLESLFSAVEAAGPAMLVGGAALLAAVALAACVLPARRAMLLEPTAALKNE